MADQIAGLTKAKASHPPCVSQTAWRIKIVSCRTVVDMTTTKSQALRDLNWAVGINRLSLHIFGTGVGTVGAGGWRNAVWKLRIVLFIVSILVMSLVPQTAALMRVWGHLLLMIDNLIAYILFVVIELQLVTLWHKNEVIATMMEYIKYDWLKPKSRQERDVMVRYGKLSRIITIGGYSIITITLICYHGPLIFGVVLRTLTNLTDFGDRPFALPTIYMFDAYRSPVYELVVISQFAICTICTFVYTTVGTLFGVIVLHVSAQLENLYNRIEEIGKNGDTGKFQAEFKFNVEEHIRLIRFSEMLESTFSLMLLEVVIGFTLLVCLQGYYILVIFEEDNERPRIQVIISISYFIYVIFIMFVYMAVGDVLVTKSERIQYATYNCEWYRLNPREAAQFIPMLVRSQRPLVITAGKFVSLTLPTFAKLLKTTAGYISCLLAVRD